jgi:hypothetical protein
MSEPHTTLDVNTKEDFLLVKHREAVGEASAKVVKTAPTRQIGELYPEYHVRLFQHLQAEAVACQEFVAEKDRLARVLAKEIFG